MKINACMVSLLLVAIIAILLLLKQPKWMKSGYSDRENANGEEQDEGRENASGEEQDEGKENMVGYEQDDGKEMYCGSCGM